MQWLHKNWRGGGGQKLPQTAKMIDDRQLQEAMELTNDIIACIDDAVGNLTAALEDLGHAADRAAQGLDREEGPRDRQAHLRQHGDGRDAAHAAERPAAGLGGAGRPGDGRGRVREPADGRALELAARAAAEGLGRPEGPRHGPTHLRQRQDGRDADDAAAAALGYDTTQPPPSEAPPQAGLARRSRWSISVEVEDGETLRI